MRIFNIDSVYAGYGSTPVIKGISSEIKKGDFTAIIGPNGAGKSTLIKVLTAILKPESGLIEFLGRPLMDYKRIEIAREMAVVSQFLENILPFNVKNFITTGRFPFKNFWETDSKEDRRITEEAMETTRTSHLKDRLLTELSGGELQLVCIARALTQNQNLIILDEPISSLDINHSIQIMDLLYELNQKGATVINVLHNINIATDYCSRIIALKDGETFFEGVPSECITGESISALFDKDCSVKTNPVTGRPYIFPHPGYTGQSNM